MLRHIMSVSLAMTACATLIPTKVNAATLSITPSYTLSIPKKKGDILEFILSLDPGSSSTVILENWIVKPDMTEFSDWFPVWEFTTNSIVDKKSVIATFKAVIGTPAKDGQFDLEVGVWYSFLGSPKTFDVIYYVANAGADVVPVPEPLTIFGTVTALGGGVLFRRKSSKKIVS
jgi:hypothetical protein